MKLDNSTTITARVCLSTSYVIGYARKSRKLKLNRVAFLHPATPPAGPHHRPEERARSLTLSQRVANGLFRTNTEPAADNGGIYDRGMALYEYCDAQW